MTFVVAQVPVSWDVEANLSSVREVVGSARAGDVVVLPEGMLSGYGEDLSPLDRLSPAVISDAVADVERLARSSGALAGAVVAVQLCREIRFPEQWQHLAAAGAQAFVYLTNAANVREVPGVWRSHLISRAAENQRFVVSSNVAHPDQHCPSMVVSPRGEVLGELPPGGAGVLRLTVDLADAGDWYLGQRRTDVVSVTSHPTQTRPAEA
ncbi:carbon-nitrogen hydrolase family protein [Actinoplanes sp. NPDC023936]|uniref:carbon-nitrogen hydrolase family protein n=1 Tax=Actinoplanes sp. NPDC023936 TaxID=3154910 RepID=UPI0033F46FB0